MNLAGAMSSALSGLTAAAAAAEVVSGNIANARTPGHVRRELVLAPAVLGGSGQGVALGGIRRDLDAALLGDRRGAAAQAAAAATAAAGLRALEAPFGKPGAAGSLAARIAALDAALIAATASPESGVRLAAIGDAAAGILGLIGEAGAAAQSARTRADRAIAADVATLNDGLGRIEALNRQIRLLVATGRDASGLMDQRQALVETIAPILPVREVARDFGQIALFTPAGGVLLDGSASAFGFAAAGSIGPAMTVGNGALSAVSVNGLAAGRMLEGGRLAANLALRDAEGPAAQALADALARDLVERFAAPQTDPTLAAGAPGLFTDAGAAFDPALETGLAQRLALNPAVDPDAGGALWRLRDGIGAAAPGDPGQSRQLLRLSAAIARGEPTGSAALPAGLRTLDGLAAEVASTLAARRLAAEDRSGFAAARAAALGEAAAQAGIDTDRELQDLLRIERAYAANARVLQVVDGMFETLLGI
jgi:flagellar hook-associated protein 1 FlgK